MVVIVDSVSRGERSVCERRTAERKATVVVNIKTASMVKPKNKEKQRKAGNAKRVQWRRGGGEGFLNCEELTLHYVFYLGEKPPTSL
jgi:hypothetical protein